MARWPDSSIFPERSSAGVSVPFPVPYSDDHRVSVPKPVSAALSWIADGSGRQEVICDLREPGRVVVHPENPTIETLNALAAADPDSADDLRLLFTSAGFILNSLRLNDRIAFHLFRGGVPLDPERARVQVRAQGDRIELWAGEYYFARVERSRARLGDDFAGD